MQRIDPQTRFYASQKRPRRGGCLRRSLATLLVLVLLLAGVWFLGVRPYIHSLVQNQFDRVLSSAVGQLDPTKAALILPGVPLPITETLINNLIVLNHSPSDTVQDAHMRITPQEIRLDFSAYGFPSTITAVPRVVNGQLIASNVSVEGITSLVMSPDEMAALLDRHLADAQARIHRSVRSVSLQNGLVEIVLG